MNASSVGLAAAILLSLLPVKPVSAAEVAIMRPSGWAHPGHMRREPEFMREDHRFSREAEERFHDDRFHRERRNFGGDWSGYYAGAAYAESAAAAPSPTFFASPINITITLPAPSSTSRSAQAHAPAAGPRIITVGAQAPLSHFAEMPIVVYGRTPVAGTY